MSTLQSTDLEQAHRFFDLTRGRLVEATAGLSEAQWRFKPAADRWSISEIFEHILMVHERILGRIAQQLAQAPAPPAERDCREVDTVVMEKIPDRSIKAQAPDFIRPKGIWNNLENLPDALARLADDYVRLSTFIETTPGLRDHVMESIPLKIVTAGAFHTMDGYQWALAAAAHDERHVRQIEELKKDPKYPA